MADVIKIKGIRDVEALLKGVSGGAAPAMVRSINRALVSARKQASKEIRKDLNVKSGEAKDSFKLIRASKTNVTGKLESTGRPLSFVGKGALRFGGTLTQKGFGFTIKKGKGRKRFPGAFILAVRSKGKSDDRRERMFIRTDKGLKALYTTRVPDALENKEAMQPVLKYAEDQLQKNLAHEMDRLLK